MFQRCLPVALNRRVCRLNDPAFAKTLKHLGQRDATLFHALLRVPRKNDALAIHGYDADLFDKTGIGKLDRLDCSHTYKVYGLEGLNVNREWIEKDRLK